MRRLIRYKDEGASLIDYALIVALISIAAIAGVRSIARPINAGFCRVTVGLSYDVVFNPNYQTNNWICRNSLDPERPAYY